MPWWDSNTILIIWYLIDKPGSSCPPQDTGYMVPADTLATDWCYWYLDTGISSAGTYQTIVLLLSVWDGSVLLQSIKYSTIQSTDQSVPGHDTSVSAIDSVSVHWSVLYKLISWHDKIYLQFHSKRYSLLLANICTTQFLLRTCDYIVTVFYPADQAVFCYRLHKVLTYVNRDRVKVRQQLQQRLRRVVTSWTRETLLTQWYQITGLNIHTAWAGCAQTHCLILRTGTVIFLTSQCVFKKLF